MLVKNIQRLFYKNKALPTYLVYFVSDICNLKCKHCLLADGAHPGWESPNAKWIKQQLSLEEIEKITINIGKGHLQFFLPTGGEPFLRKDLSEIVRLFHQNTGVTNVGIPTNGSLTEQVLVTTEAILMNCPDLHLGVDISLDGVEDQHDHIRQKPGLFNTAVDTYHQLNKLKKHFPKFNLNIETTVSAYNDKHLEANYKYFKNRLQPDNVFTLLTRGKPQEPTSKFFDISRYEKYSELLSKEQMSGALRGYHNFPLADLVNAKRIVRSQLIARTVKTSQYQIPCEAGRLGGTIFANGDVFPCELQTELKMGNLRESGYNFRKIWLSKRARHISRHIRETKCFCTYECYQSINILYNLRMYPKLISHVMRLKWGRWRSGLSKSLRYQEPS